MSAAPNWLIREGAIMVREAGDILEEYDLRAKDAVVPEGVADYIVRMDEYEDLLMPLQLIVPLQLFAYYMAVLRGCDVDKPRNLAKSVTVE